jgi:nucleoside-diphosphate-sugar epimerase
MGERPIIVVAGAAGDLGSRIAKALIARGAAVRTTIRREDPQDKKAKLSALGVDLVTANPESAGEMSSACADAKCVVSALNGVRDVIIERQSVLLGAAVKAGVRRFIPSDYSVDFTKTGPGDNRNLDLRREFMSIADRAPIRVTSILNGAFMDMLGHEMPIIQPRIRRILYWHNADQPLDFTTKDDVAAYVAAAAMDEATPRFLRIAGDSVSAGEIAATMTAVTGDQYRTLWAGSIGMLGAMIRIAKIVSPQPNVTFPPWQGMQYMRDQFSGRAKLDSLDNGRYLNLSWTSVRKLLLDHHP